MRKFALLVVILGVAGYLGRDRLKTHLPQKLAARLAPPPPRPVEVAAVTPPAAPPDAGPPAQPGDGLQHIAVVLHGPLEKEVVAQVGKETGPALSLVMQRISLWWMSPGDARNGDQIRAVYELPAGHEPLIKALRYTSQKTGQTYAAYYYKAPGAKYGRYYTADGQELEERLKDAPVNDYEQVTSFLKDGRHHQGVDFKCESGTPVVMPFNGTLLRKNWNWHGNGNCLEFVDAKTGNHAKFLHLSPLPESLKPGMKFTAGQQVALSGNTGHTTAPHLHYQLESASERILDPFKIHPTYREKLSDSFMPGFKQAVGQLDTSLAREP